MLEASDEAFAARTASRRERPGSLGSPAGVRSSRGVVTVKTAGGATQTRMVRCGSSYLSQSQLALTFGLGSASSVDRVDVEWPSGRKDALTNVRANQTITIQESRGPQPSAIR